VRPIGCWPSIGPWLRLEALDPRLARVVECRVFAGLSEAETAEALDLSLRSVQRHWLRARGWLRQELES
jgi:DNA-directed RNA polymerase specialized sigma24 family protein